MSDKNVLLHRAVRGALAMGAAGGLVGGGAALAQVPTAAPAGGTAAGATNLSAITVTGSHIPQTAIATAQPVVAISRQQIENTGFTTVGQILQSITSSGSALNETYNNGGNGAEFVNIHDLGSKRVLVLVNGQRWIPQLGGQVDLTSIPASVIQRIDVLLDGASAVYGSDAIAGVINIITLKNFNGAQANAYFGEYDGHNDGGGWDGRTQKYTFTVGTSGDRSGVLLSAGYYEQNPIFAGQRTISKEPFFGCGQLCGSSNGKVGRYVLTGTGFPGDFAGKGCGPEDSIITGGPGCDIAGPLVSANGISANPHPYTVADNYNYAPTGYLLTPQERWDIYSQGHYDLTDNITFHFTTTYNRRNSNQTLAQNPWALGYAGYTANGLPIGISAANPYNPFGVDLVPVLAPGASPSVTDAWCSKFGGAAGGGCTANYDALYLQGWRPLAAPLRKFAQTVHTFYFTGGFRGYWQMFGNQWTWNADYIYGNKQNTTITTGLASTAQIQKHLGPDCTGTTPDADCVALNMFSGASGQTPAQVQPLLFTAHSVQEQTLRDYNAGIGGSFFNGWYAGPWGVAVGYEYEEVDGFFSPDAIISTGNTVGNVAQPTQGREKTDAQYAELTIPFARDLPFAKEITVDLANRWSQFKYSGIGNQYNLQTRQLTTLATSNEASASTGRVTLKWRPVSQLLLRAAWSQGFRIPSISELFGGAVGNFPGLSDPCAPPPFGGHKSGPLPPGCSMAHTQTSGQVVTTVGGNPLVGPEQSISRSVGFVYSPNWAPGLNISADYFKVEVDGLIGSPGIQFYANECYIRNNPSACEHLFVKSGIIIRGVALNSNAGSDTIEGIDGNFNYKLPMTPVGQFTAGLGFTFIKSDVYCDPVGNCSQNAGGTAGGSFATEPKHRYNFSLDWNFGPWSAAYNMYIIGNVWEDCAQGTGENVNGQVVEVCSNPEKYNGPEGQTGQNSIGTTIYSDLQASYTVSSWNTTFTLGVNNLFDKNPPIARASFANSFYPNYRIPGRFWYGRVSVNF